MTTPWLAPAAWWRARSSSACRRARRAPYAHIGHLSTDGSRTPGRRAARCSCRVCCARTRRSAPPACPSPSTCAPSSPVSLCRSGESRVCATRGGVRLSVAGDLAPPLMAQWRAGRTVRVPATLREPTVYRDPGVPDEQRALARRGIALVGSVKSAALVEVVSRGSTMSEHAAAFRAWVRGVLAATVAPWSVRSAAVAAAISIGDRTGLAPADEERLQAAGTYHVIAISGGNIAILTVLLRCNRALARSAGARRGACDHCRAAGLRTGDRFGRLRRSRHCRGHSVSVRAPAGASRSADQRSRRRRNAGPDGDADDDLRSGFHPFVRRDTWDPDRRSAVDHPVTRGSPIAAEPGSDRRRADWRRRQSTSRDHRRRDCAGSDSGRDVRAGHRRRSASSTSSPSRS